MRSREQSDEYLYLEMTSPLVMIYLSYYESQYITHDIPIASAEGAVLVSAGTTDTEGAGVTSTAGSFDLNRK